MNGEKLTVRYHDRVVGILTETREHRIAFAYDREWLEHGFAISPFSLPLQEGVFVPTKLTFEGMYAVFADSLPDAWGRLLMDRMLKKHHFDRDQMNSLQRLGLIGQGGKGALCYEPARTIGNITDIGDLDATCDACQEMLRTRDTQNLDQLYALAGMTGGAQPKIMTDAWIIKFPAAREESHVGVMEKAYMDAAEDCGILVSETQLLPSKRCDGYFATKRFDWIKTEDGICRKHVVTVAGILETDWRIPSLDYHALMKLTKILCRDRKESVEQMFRRMCFNVFAHNRDDHSKNFSFLYDDAQEKWELTPAYDLTYSNTFYGEHTTTVDGNGRDPGIQEILAVGKAANMKSATCKRIAEEIQEKTRELVKTYGT